MKDLPKRFRPDILPVEGINWKRILQIVSYVEGVRKIDLVTDAVATYLESRLDDAICTLNPDTDYPLEEMKMWYQKLRAFNLLDKYGEKKCL